MKKIMIALMALIVLTVSDASADEMSKNEIPLALEVFSIVKNNSIYADRLKYIDPTTLMADENKVVENILKTINDPQGEYHDGAGQKKDYLSSVFAQTFKEKKCLIGYVSFTRFSSDAGIVVENILRRMISDKEIGGLILDLRDNEGGLLSEAQRIAGVFLKKNDVIAFLVDNKNGKETMRNKGENKIFDKPLIILINGKSASSSEIVANALQFHKIAVVMGTPSYGKNSIQMVYALKNNGYIRITTGEWKGPDEKTFKKVIPNVIVNHSNSKNEDLQFKKAIEKITYMIEEKKKKTLLMKRVKQKGKLPPFAGASGIFLSD